MQNNSEGGHDTPDECLLSAQTAASKESIQMTMHTSSSSAEMRRKPQSLST